MNCLTCKHNTYIGIKSDWFDCSHPITLELGVRWERGAPAMVDYRTSDVPASRVKELGNCPTYEPATPREGE